MTDDDNIVRLFAGDDDGGEALEAWADRLLPYLQEREMVEPVRHREMPNPPWPERDPMLGYLVERAGEISDADGERAGLIWLAVHAWFEGAVEQRHRDLRHLLNE